MLIPDITARPCPIRIRPATTQDADALQRIYAPYVVQTAVTYEYEPPTVQEFRRRIEKTLQRFPYLVAEIEDEVVGYAYAVALKERKACDCSVEVSIYIRQEYHGQGVGRCLYEVLEQHLCQMGITHLYASISATNRQNDPYLTDASIRFHQRMGFRQCGCFHGCGVKFNLPYDLLWMEKLL